MKPRVFDNAHINHTIKHIHLGIKIPRAPLDGEIRSATKLDRFDKNPLFLNLLSSKQVEEFIFLFFLTIQRGCKSNPNGLPRQQNETFQKTKFKDLIDVEKEIENHLLDMASRGSEP